MSYDIHEAYSLDSFQDSLLFWDDFEGDSLKDLWNLAGNAGGSGVVVDAQDGGVLRITTNGDDNAQYRVRWGDIRSLLASKKVTIEIRAKLETASAINSILGLYFDDTHGIIFEYDADTDANWQITTDDGTGPTTADSGIAADALYHIFRIECFPTGEAHYYIDTVETGNSPLSADIPTEHLQPYLFVRAREAATKYIDVDYVYARQLR